MNQAGKGDSPRPVIGDKFRENFDSIFRKDKPKEAVTEKPKPPYEVYAIIHGMRWTETCCFCGRQEELRTEEDFDISKHAMNADVEEQMELTRQEAGWEHGYCPDHISVLIQEQRELGRDEG
jgi:hypothetical protein